MRSARRRRENPHKLRQYNQLAAMAGAEVIARMNYRAEIFLEVLLEFFELLIEVVDRVGVTVLILSQSRLAVSRVGPNLRVSVVRGQSPTTTRLPNPKEADVSALVRRGSYDPGPLSRAAMRRLGHIREEAAIAQADIAAQAQENWALLDAGERERGTA
jgi:hypothetical protein